jgi:hypothetical protein
MRSVVRPLAASVLTYWTLMTWPSPVARAALGVAFRSPTYGVAEAIDAVRVFVSVGAALSVVAFSSRGAATPWRFLRAGAVGGAVVGGACFALTELVQHTSTCPSAACKLWLATRVMLMGGLWAAPIAVPVGVLVGTILWLVASLVGAIETSWWRGQPVRRASALVAIMLVQSALGFWLHRTLGL